MSPFPILEVAFTIEPRIRLQNPNSIAVSSYYIPRSKAIIHAISIALYLNAPITCAVDHERKPFDI